MSESEKVMVVSSRGSLDTVCTSNVSPNLMLRRWACTELGLADEVVVAGLVLALLRPRNGEDVRVGSGIQSLSSVGCCHRFGVHDPCRTHSICYCLFLLGLTLSEMATS